MELSVCPYIFKKSEDMNMSKEMEKEITADVYKRQIQTTLMKPEVKKAGTEQIKKKAKSSIIEQLSRKKKEMAEWTASIGMSVALQLCKKR